MPDERRYTQPEIETIFEMAATEPRTLASGSARDGLTLSELQAIGEEVGLAPGRIADAAASLDRRHTPRQRLTAAGVPVGVRMSFDLPRAPTDREWGMIVAELRRIFGAEGKVTSTVGLREWRNGNLHATVEPTAAGYQLRLGTRKGQAPALALSSFFMFLVAFGVYDDGGTAGAIILGLIALMFLAPLFRLPQWASLREAQMEEIGQWAIQLIGAGAGSDDPSLTPPTGKLPEADDRPSPLE
jgi:hypothetical protein